MGKCYECKYYRITERKCGYKGYSTYPDKECSAAEFQRGDGSNHCGTCKYYRVESKLCTQSGQSKYPYDSCGTYKYSRA